MEYGEKQGITERNSVAGNGSEGWDGVCRVVRMYGEHDRMIRTMVEGWS